ncbi:MAG TPA: restriction endonuclease subunit S [Acidobacteriota bacterium]|nr:restriction endonuclease subunit S [Acidobacteriota bacterium]
MKKQTLQTSSMTIPKKVLKDLVVETKRGLSSYYLQPEGKLVQFINIRDVVDGRVNQETVTQANVKETDAFAKTRIEPNDVIVTVKGSAFKAGVASQKEKDAIISANLIAFKLKPEIQPELVVAYLNSPKGQQELHARSAGIAQKFLSERALLEISIPVPPMEKQKQLAVYLQLSKEYDTLMERERDLRKQINNSVVQNMMG